MDPRDLPPSLQQGTAFLAQPNGPSCSWRDCVLPKNAVFARAGHVGSNVKINSPIGTPDNPLDYVYIGDNVYIGEGCNIQVPRLVIGDYTKLHRNSLVFGRNPLIIGYNCWFGENTVIDAEGFTTIGNGVGVGAYSQLFSHIRHGDTLEGCRYLGFGELTIEDDCWFVGSVRVGPIHAEKKAVAMLGSTITKDMPENTVWGGCPAKDLTDKLGAPFFVRTISEKRDDFQNRIARFREVHPEHRHASLDNFSITTRTYHKTGSPAEIAFMRFLLPEAKFIPSNERLPNPYLE